MRASAASICAVSVAVSWRCRSAASAASFCTGLAQRVLCRGTSVGQGLLVGGEGGLGVLLRRGRASEIAVEAVPPTFDRRSDLGQAERRHQDVEDDKRDRQPDQLLGKVW